MSLRFFKRISVGKGCTFNLSKGGISMSLGQRGSKMTFGTSGITTTLGATGTGLFYTEHFGSSGNQNEKSDTNEIIDNLYSSGGGCDRVAMDINQWKDMFKRVQEDSNLSLHNPETGRKMSLAGIQAQIKRMELQNTINENVEKIEKEEKEYTNLLNYWKILPPILTTEVIQNAFVPKKFVCNIPPPLDCVFPEQPLLNEEQEKEIFKVFIMDELKSKFPYTIIPLFLLKKKVLCIFKEKWDSRFSEILKKHEESIKEYQYDVKRITEKYNFLVEEYKKQVAILKDKWDLDEQDRLSKLQKIIDGDLLATHNASVEILQGVHFPFETNCEISLKDPHSVFINLDLPEIEKVIPEYKKRVLKNGNIEKSKIDTVVRNKDYFNLVVGQSVSIAYRLFANLPHLSTVRVSGYTQKPLLLVSDEIDTYIFDIVFTKSFIESFDPKKKDLYASIRALTTAIEIKDNWEFNKIKRPIWIGENKENA